RIVGDDYIFHSMGLTQLSNLRTSEVPGSFMPGIVRDPDIADPFDPGIGPGVKHSVIKNAIDRNRGANAKRKRQDRGEGEGRVADDLPQCEADILEHNL